MNFASIKDKFDPDSPRAVVWQYTDPYQPRDQPDPDPMLPQTLLVAYEENGRGETLLLNNMLSCLIGSTMCYNHAFIRSPSRRFGF